MTGQLVAPLECVQWCQARDYGIAVADDLAAVDLDWWNTRLSTRRIPARVWGRTIDGAPTDHGEAFLRRGDLKESALPHEGPTDLGVLYRAAAWLCGHPSRAHARRFPDIRTPGRTGDFTEITAALAHCRNQHPVNLDPGPYRSWSGWPRTPGVGPALLSLYCWAVHDTTPGRPQLLDQHSLATLCHLGWLQIPSVPAMNRTRYLRYNDLLHYWATDTGITAELIEMWLAHNWRQRTHGARG